MAGKDLPGVHFVESVAIAALDEDVAFAVVKRRAVGCDRHQDVVWSVIEMLGELDSSDNVCKPGNSDVFELPDDFRINLAAAGQVVAADFAAEQKVQPVARGVGDPDYDVRVHDVVDERNMLVADALNVVLAVSVA